jgi:hypothetical protein
MTRYLISAAAVVLLYASPVLAADTMKPSSPPAGANAAGSDTGKFGLACPVPHATGPFLRRCHQQCTYR